LSNRPKAKTAAAQETKVFQRSLKSQAGFSLESSYMNKAPPIGAPKATLTPAEAPAAMYYLFILSFWQKSYPGK
jgi:hypothetical protein